MTGQSTGKWHIAILTFIAWVAIIATALFDLVAIFITLICFFGTDDL
jgi:hypothetical protein